MVAKNISRIVGLLLVSIALFSCGTKKVVNLAYIAPLSGTNSLLGLEGRDGFALSLTKYFDKDYDLRVSYFDDKGDAAQSLDLVKSIVKQGIKHIIFNSTSGASLESIKYASSQGVFCFSATVSSGDLAGKKDFFFRSANSNITFGKTIAEMIMAQSPKEQKLKIVSIGDLSNANYVNSINGSASLTLESKGHDRIIEQVFDGNSSFNGTEIAEKIMKQDPDWVMLIANPLNSANIMQNLRKLGIKARVFLSPFGANIEYIKQAGASSEDTFVLSTSLFDKNETYLEFAKLYREKTGKEASYFAQYGYDTAWVLYQIFNQLDDLPPESLAKYLEGGKEFKGLNNPIRIDEFGDALATFYLYQVKNGSFELSDSK